MMLIARKTRKGDCMMNSIVAEKLISFKELEQKVFKYICELGCEITRIMLESYDRELATTRDTKQYRDKGSRKTSIKIVYGSIMGYREAFFAYNPGFSIPFKSGTYYKCCECGCIQSKSKITIDHKIPKRDGGTDDYWNLQPMCRFCNSRKKDNQSIGDNVGAVLNATLNGDLDKLAKGIAKQKVKDVLGIKYRLYFVFRM